MRIEDGITHLVSPRACGCDIRPTTRTIAADRQVDRLKDQVRDLRGQLATKDAIIWRLQHSSTQPNWPSAPPATIPGASMHELYSPLSLHKSTDNNESPPIIIKRVLVPIPNEIPLIGTLLDLVA